MEIKANITMSRDNRNVVTIEIQDEASRSKFVKVHLTLENLALMMTGLAHVECEADVRNLEAVGKTKVSEDRKVEVPSSLGYDKVKIQDYIKDNFKEDGWELNVMLNSQRSLVNEGDKKFANYSVFKYV